MCVCVLIHDCACVNVARAHMHIDGANMWNAYRARGSNTEVSKWTPSKKIVLSCSINYCVVPHKTKTATKEIKLQLRNAAFPTWPNISVTVQDSLNVVKKWLNIRLSGGGSFMVLNQRPSFSFNISTTWPKMDPT